MEKKKNLSSLLEKLRKKTQAERKKEIRTAKHKNRFIKTVTK